VRNDPVRLWRHVAERLLGEPKDAFARTARALLLVSAAAGRIDGDQLAAVITAAGWSPRTGAPAIVTPSPPPRGTSTRCSTSSGPMRGADS
jgi:hypothetical protein